LVKTCSCYDERKRCEGKKISEEKEVKEEDLREKK